MSPHDITTIVVNHRTPDLTWRCVDSFMHCYPDARLILIDNGSRDSSTAYVASLANRFEHVTCILNGENRYHGPAIDQGIRAASTRYVFTLDSDCLVHRGGFLEEMQRLFRDPDLYATGRLVYMNRFGFEAEPVRPRRLIPYVHPHAMLLDREKYLRLRPFVHHGSPCLENMKDAYQKGYRVAPFAVEQFVLHYGRGTCSRYGYSLGPRTLIEAFLTRTGLF